MEQMSKTLEQEAKYRSTTQQWLLDGSKNKDEG